MKVRLKQTFHGMFYAYLAFRVYFDHRSIRLADFQWCGAYMLLIGVIPAPGKRAVTSALRVVDLSDERRFEFYHRVLNRGCLELPPSQSHPAPHAGRRVRPNRPARACH